MPTTRSPLRRGTSVNCVSMVASSTRREYRSSSSLPQLEAIIESTPSDAYDVVIAAVDPTPAIRSLLDSLGGEVQVLDVDPSGDPWTVAAAAARYECVLLVAPGVCPTHGWHVGLLDALAGTDTDSEPAAVAAVRIDDAQYRDVTIVAAPPTDCILAHRASVAGWRIDDDKLAAAARDAGGAILAHPASRVHVAG